MAQTCDLREAGRRQKRRDSGVHYFLRDHLGEEGPVISAKQGVGAAASASDLAPPYLYRAEARMNEARMTDLAMLQLRQAASSTHVGCLRPGPLAAIITDLCMSQVAFRPSRPRGDEFVGALLGHAVAAATAIANQTASPEPPATCCALCLKSRAAWHLKREPVVPSFLVRPDAGAAVARHSVFACGECLHWGREWEATFRRMYAAGQGATVSGDAARPGGEQRQQGAHGLGVDRGTEAALTRNSAADDGDGDDVAADDEDSDEAATDDEDGDDAAADDEDTLSAREEHVRNYIAFVCLKALMCPTLIRHPDRGESVLGPKLRPWATLVHHLRDQLILERFVCYKARPVRVTVWVSLIPEDSFLARHHGGDEDGQEPLPAWGFAPAAQAVVVPLGRFLVAFALPTSTLPQQPEWAECPAGTSDLWRLLRDKKPWSNLQVSTFLRDNSCEEGRVAHAL